MISTSYFTLLAFVMLIWESTSFTNVAHRGTFPGSRYGNASSNRAMMQEGMHLPRHIVSNERRSIHVISASSTNYDNDPVSYSNDDLLMRISFVSNGGSTSEAEAIELIQAYIASFPFSVVLPVQPLTYKPREGGDGVDLSFLRKKTQEKGAIDGGMKFILTSDCGDGGEFTVVLKAFRDSNGQTVSKVFSEGLIIKSFVAGLLDEEGGKVGLGKDELLSKIEIKEFVHKWMM